jgi:hypothetical protein
MEGDQQESTTGRKGKSGSRALLLTPERMSSHEPDIQLGPFSWRKV